MLNNILYTLQSKYPEGRTEGNSYTIKCIVPGCSTSNKNHLWIDLDKGVAICWKCGWQTFNWYETRRKLNLTEHMFVRTSQEPKPRMKKYSRLPTGEYPCTSNPDIISFLAGRGVSLGTIEQFGVGISYEKDNYEGYLIIPAKNIYIARNIYHKKFYVVGSREATIYNLPDIYSADNICVLVEGPFDVLPDILRTDVRYIPCAILGSSLTKAQLNILLTRFEKYIIWLDPDAREPQRKIYNTILNAGKQVVECYESLEPGDHPRPVDVYRRLLQ